MAETWDGNGLRYCVHIPSSVMAILLERVLVLVVGPDSDCARQEAGKWRRCCAAGVGQAQRPRAALVGT
jgi:hypothetical protein